MSHETKFTFEHVAINVRDREPVERWYRENLGLKAVRSVPGSMVFLADSGGRVVFELYANPTMPVTDFPSIHPLTFHVAFAVEDVDAAARDLVAAGATIFEAAKVVNGDRMIMLQDPFGMGLQLVRRTAPMV